MTPWQQIEADAHEQFGEGEPTLIELAEWLGVREGNIEPNSFLAPDRNIDFMAQYLLKSWSAYEAEFSRRQT